MEKLNGSCHCGGITVEAAVSVPPAELKRRKCDCSFCMKHGASYISDPKGSLTFQVSAGATLNKYRQGESGAADFLMCAKCGVLMGTLFTNPGGKFYGALNGSIFDEGVLGDVIPISPRLLPKEEKLNRWQQVWFPELQINEAFTSEPVKPVTVKATDVPPRLKPSVYPEPFRSRMNGRIKAQIGEFLGLKNFGVNLTRLAPGAESALFHKHSRQDEFIYILEGEATLITEAGEEKLLPGMCAGFRARGTAHQLVNRSGKEVAYLEVGDRTTGDEGLYPRDDLKAQLTPNGEWLFTRKDGTPY